MTTKNLIKWDNDEIFHISKNVAYLFVPDNTVAVQFISAWIVNGEIVYFLSKIKILYILIRRPCKEQNFDLGHVFLCYLISIINNTGFRMFLLILIVDFTINLLKIN